MQTKKEDTEKSKTLTPKELIEIVEENCRAAEETQQKYWTAVGLENAVDHYRKAKEACDKLTSDKSLSNEERSRYQNRSGTIGMIIRDIHFETDYYRSLDPLERQEYVEMKYRKFLKPQKD